MSNDTDDIELDIAVLQEIHQNNDLLYEDPKMGTDVDDGVSPNGASDTFGEYEDYGTDAIDPFDNLDPPSITYI